MIKPNENMKYLLTSITPSHMISILYSNNCHIENTSSNDRI